MLTVLRCVMTNYESVYKLTNPSGGEFNVMYFNGHVHVLR